MPRYLLFEQMSMLGLAAMMGHVRSVVTQLAGMICTGSFPPSVNPIIADVHVPGKLQGICG